MTNTNEPHIMNQQQRQQQRQIQRLQQQHAAEQQREQRQQLALEQGDESKQGQRVWIIPEFDPGVDEQDYIIEEVRDALPEYDCRMAIDSTAPMTKERIMEMLAGCELKDDEE